MRIYLLKLSKLNKKSETSGTTKALNYTGVICNISFINRFFSEYYYDDNGRNDGNDEEILGNVCQLILWFVSLKRCAYSTIRPLWTRWLWWHQHNFLFEHIWKNLSSKYISFIGLNVDRCDILKRISCKAIFQIRGNVKQPALVEPRTV